MGEVRQPTPEETAKLVSGESYVCALCAGIFDKVWSDEEAEAEHVSTFGGPSDVRDDGSGEDSIICDPCYQKVAAHYGWRRN